MIFKILCKNADCRCSFSTSSVVNYLISIHKASCDDTGLQQLILDFPRLAVVATREKIAAFSPIPVSDHPAL